MENQHRKISGYRELFEDEINIMNEIKQKAEEVRCLVNALENLENSDKRWVEDGKMDLQKGFMSLVRSVAQPTTF